RFRRCAASRRCSRCARENAPGQYSAMRNTAAREPAAIAPTYQTTVARTSAPALRTPTLDRCVPMQWHDPIHVPTHSRTPAKELAVTTPRASILASTPAGSATGSRGGVGRHDLGQGHGQVGRAAIIDAERTLQLFEA